MDYSKFNFYKTEPFASIKKEMDEIFNYLQSLNEDDQYLEFEKLLEHLIAAMPPNLVRNKPSPIEEIIQFKIIKLSKNCQKKFLEFYKKNIIPDEERRCAKYLIQSLDKIDNTEILQAIVEIGGDTLQTHLEIINHIHGYKWEESIKKYYGAEDGKIPEFFVYKIYEDYYRDTGSKFSSMLQKGLIEPTQSLAKYISNFKPRSYTDFEGQQSQDNYKIWVLFINLGLFKNLGTEVALGILKSGNSEEFLSDLESYTSSFDLEEINKNRDKNLMYKSFYVSEIFKYPKLASKIC